jgi:murein DD-endopeptidase MepM/ murein hydrolase activator NlpD
MTEVVAVTDALVVFVGTLSGRPGGDGVADILDGHRSGTPVEGQTRYDRVWMVDGRGWYYHYSHLSAIEPAVAAGAIVSRGDPLGRLGREGGSGGWPHLHLEIKSRQPSGEWGTSSGRVCH